MGKIVAIGGGELRFNETFEIDKFIVEFSEVPTPKLLFIPTASHDAPAYIEFIKKVYGEQLGCNVDVLLLIDNKNMNQEDIKEKIFTSDIIYVGGGNTSMMMEVWKKYKVDEYLETAYKKNIVLSGLSAGSICWFKQGNSETEIVKNNEPAYEYKIVDGVGLIDAFHCPHYNEDGRESFDKMMETQGLTGIAIENNCAIIIKDDKYKIIRCSDSNKAYLLKNNNGVVEKKELICEKYSPLSNIL